MDLELRRVYGDRFRTRVCGLCWQDEKLLMVRHSGLTKSDFWSVPGGGMEFGKTAIETLIKEFDEETGIVIEPGRFLFSCEFLKPPLHAIELFFEVTYRSGLAVKGFDPEIVPGKQIIQEVCWMSPAEILRIPKENIHGIFNLCSMPQDLMKLTGYWQI